VLYEVTEQVGPPHDRIFTVAAIVGVAPIAEGSGRSKKLAEQDAARRALRNLGPLVGEAESAER